MNSIMDIDIAIKGIHSNVERMKYILSFDISYNKWMEYYLEYRALRRYSSYGEEFIKLGKELGKSLIDAKDNVSCTKEEEDSLNSWCESIIENLGYSKKLEI